MAGLSNTDELRREIQELAAENAELKQLLLDNQDLKNVLRNQYNDSSNLLPVHESTQLEGQDHFGSQPFLNSSSFAPNTSFRLSVLQPLNSTPQFTTPPMTPGGAGPIFMGQLPLSSGRFDSTPLSPNIPQMFTPPPLSPGDLGVGQPPQAPRGQRMPQFPFPQFQSPPVAHLNLWSPPQNLLRLRTPGTPDSGMQGAGFVTPDGSSQEFSFRSNSTPGRVRGRGYCVECAIPLHPHLPQGSLADSVLRGSSSDGSAQNSSSSSAGPGAPRSAATGSSSYGPGSPLNSPHPLGLSSLNAPAFSPTGAAFCPAVRPSCPASPKDIAASFSSGQSSQSDYDSPHTPQQGYVSFSPNYLQSFSPSGFTSRPEIFSQPPAGKILPSSPGARTLGMLAPQSPSPFTFPSALQSTPVHSPQAPGTKVHQTPPEPKTKAHGESNRQATSVTIKKSSKDSKQTTMERIVGEIAFQLDRRILSTIFPDRVRLYGFTVSNIPEKIRQNGSEAQSGLTEDQCRAMMERYNSIMGQLKPLGYDPSTHPRVTEQIVNTYGILRERPDTRGTEGDLYNDIEYLRNIVQTTVPANKCADCMMLLNCLHKLSQDDGKPLFIW